MIQRKYNDNSLTAREAWVRSKLGRVGALTKCLAALQPVVSQRLGKAEPKRHPRIQDYKRIVSPDLFRMELENKACATLGCFTYSRLGGLFWGLALGL